MIQEKRRLLMKKVIHVMFHLIFWLWNLLGLLIAYVWIVPAISVPLIKDTLAGLVPFDFVVTLGVLISVPTACTIVGFWKLRKLPLQLIRLFYGVEAPLFLLGLLRLFLIRERTAVSTWMIGTFLVAIAVFTIDLLYSHIRQQRIMGWFHLLTHTLMFLTGLYVGTLLLFYIIPAGFIFLRGFFRFHWVVPLFQGLTDVLRHGNLSALFWIPVWLTFAGLTILLFLSLPSAFVSFYTFSGYRQWQIFAARHGKKATWLGAIAAIVLWVVLTALFQRQPQIETFGMLNNPPPNENARRELLAQKETIRKGLLNAYLHAYRYLSTREENTHIQEIYHEVFGLDRDVARILQRTYNQLVSPFLYSGFSNDDEKAAKLYGEFFDTPIQKGEQRAIQHALQSTFNRDEAKAGLLNINQEKVWLAQQRVTIEPHGDWAKVELYEVYENQTWEEQEVFYSFSLPESAVITGIWLGNSPDLAQRFVFQVSPRGAAQQVYTNEVRRQRDPALLEQVGPRHYRLRAFPVPRRLQTNRGEKSEQPRLHLWLTYNVLRQEDAWPLPHLGEKRNVFWTRKTACNYNGYTLKHPGQDWLPPSLQANQPSQPETREVMLPGGYKITAKPLTPAEYILPKGKRFAVLLDTSYSLTAHVKTIQTAFAWLQETLAAQNQIDVYLADSQNDRAQRIADLHNLNPKKLVFFGTIQFKDILRQFDRLRGDTAYDAIVLMTDAGSYELADDDKTLPRMPAPLWMVHINGLPKAYDDTTLQAIQQSGGGVATSVPDVFRRMATTAQLGESVVSVTDSYAWFLTMPEQPANLSGQTVVPATERTDSFEPFAVRQLILGLSRQLDLTALANLDVIHTLAKAYHIVSPYSSMIVLVNDAQREALKKAEAQADRFDREVETGHEALEKPFNPLHVAGTGTPIPEPGTIVLVGVGGIVLAYFVFKKRRQ
jgi:putative PEP-CTERM system integral membrane protein